MYLKPIQTSKMKPFVKIVNDLMPLTIFTKSSILDVWLVSKTSTKSFNKSFCKFNFISFINFISHFVKYFFPSLCNFLFLPIFQNDLQVLLYRASIFIEYLRKNIQKYANFSLTWQVCDNFKRNLHHFNMKNVEHVQLLRIKMRED